MNNTKLDSIALGLKYGVQVLLYRQLESDIKDKPPTQIAGNEQEYLLLKLEEGKISPSNETNRRLFDNLTSERGFASLEEELFDTKRKLDTEGSFRNSESASGDAEPQQSSGTYFYIAAVIALLNSLIFDNTDKLATIRYFKRLRPLFEKASGYSKDIGVKSPSIYNQRLDHSSSLEPIKRSLALWFSSLKRQASCDETKDERLRLVIRGLLRGIPYLGNALDALLFGKQ